MSLISTKEHFLFPVENLRPFDKEVSEIVKTLKAHGFKVDGIEVRLESFGHGLCNHRYVREIIGENFRLLFGARQGDACVAHYDCAGLRCVWVGQYQVEFDNENNVSVTIYAGDDWENDREMFIGGYGQSLLAEKCLHYEKFQPEPGKFIDHNEYARRRRVYKDSSADGIFPVKLYAVTNEDYRAPNSEESFELETNDLMVTVWCELKSVLDDLKKLHVNPFADGREGYALLPYVDKLGGRVPYAIIHEAALNRIKDGGKNPDDHYVVGPVHTLIPACLQVFDAVPEELKGAYIWCGTTPDDVSEGYPRYDNMPAITAKKGDTVVKVTPKYADCCKVVDYSKYKQLLGQFMGDSLGDTLSSLTDDDKVVKLFEDLSKTVKSLYDYNEGDFENPVLVIGRELDLDEVEVLADAKIADSSGDGDSDNDPLSKLFNDAFGGIIRIIVG